MSAGRSATTAPAVVRPPELRGAAPPGAVDRAQGEQRRAHGLYLFGCHSFLKLTIYRLDASQHGVHDLLTRDGQFERDPPAVPGVTGPFEIAAVHEGIDHLGSPPVWPNERTDCDLDAIENCNQQLLRRTLGKVSKPQGAGAKASDKMSSVDGVIATLRARGGRATSSRRVLLDVLFHADTHLTAEELAAAVQQRAPGVHMSTIYRSLDDLQHLGVIVHSHLGHGPATYQLASLAHAHFICESCGATLEAPDELFQGLARTARAKLGFAIDPHHFAMLGRCARCVEASTSTSAP